MVFVNDCHAKSNSYHLNIVPWDVFFFSRSKESLSFDMSNPLFTKEDAGIMGR